MTLRILVVFGTRPEAIKMSPVVRALQAQPEIETLVCVTGQHRQMLDQVLDFFAIVPDFDLNIMKPGQDLFDVTTEVMQGLKLILRDIRPDYMLVHGDTTTCLAASLAGFYEQVSVAHVEAGLRTGNMHSPFPEEMNRVVAGRIASLHFAPTRQAFNNLRSEGVAPHTIRITGNTVIDALLFARNKIKSQYSELYWQQRFGAGFHDCLLSASRKILVTGHRRENFGDGIRRICEALGRIASQHPDWMLIYPVHMNPNVKGPVLTLLGASANVHLIEPLEYDAFVWMMNECDVIVTDSGGVQEEAPSLGKPVLVTRDTTERPEAVAAGTVKLVGTDAKLLYEELTRLLCDTEYYNSMSKCSNPYGDGLASNRIVQALSGRTQDIYAPDLDMALT